MYLVRCALIDCSRVGNNHKVMQVITKTEPNE